MTFVRLFCSEMLQHYEVLASLLQSITEVPGRQLIHNGDLAELDLETFVQIQRVHMFLLNDSLMIASWLPNR